MSRMVDRLFRSGLQVPPFIPPAEEQQVVGSLRGLTPLLSQQMQGAEVLVVDNVCDYFYAGTGQEHWEWERDFPCLAPPFESFWMETLAPKRTVSEVHEAAVPPSCFFHAWGAMVWGEKWESLPAHHAGFYLRHLPPLPRKPHWVLTFLPFMEERKFHIFPVGRRHMFLDAEGRAIFVRGTDGHSSILDIPLSMDPDAIWATRYFMGRMLLPFGLAISFLHCRNVHTVEQRPPAALAKAHARKHGRPRFRYHVLEIEPMKRVLRIEGRSEEVGLQQALHICRGHFKDYRERGLFGKHRGIYWWDSYLRGRPEFGVVAKDYSVLPAAAAAGGGAA